MATSEEMLDFLSLEWVMYAYGSDEGIELLFCVCDTWNPREDALQRGDYVRISSVLCTVHSLPAWVQHSPIKLHHELPLHCPNAGPDFVTATLTSSARHLFLPLARIGMAIGN